MDYHLFEDDNLNLDLVFEENELADFKEMWVAGISVENMAKKMKRRPSEIALLVFDHAERNLITKRQQGIYGL
ncbi:hypothetical protein [Planomicrobium sp. CPCC 101079]|uniref:hypothetical protein n=1 Tax=Planomicrobium sp. CPCC 101079 TaxID=2599618 RepID=UPI0011B6BA95|nr:hypothetical protein [Planomicrobium sp. CPCC 101079]TWT04622.1 hypothetical protein FQV28_08440 [Planomicrobium sp. CPCC 101079]